MFEAKTMAGDSRAVTKDSRMSFTCRRPCDEVWPRLCMVTMYVRVYFTMSCFSPQPESFQVVPFLRLNTMNQTVSLATDLVANPPKELKDLLQDPRVPDTARQAMSELTSSNKPGDGRLQVVDENQNFT